MKAKVTVPATVANLGPALDSMALALGLYNVVSVSGPTYGAVEVIIAGDGADGMPGDRANPVVKAAEAVYRLVGADFEGMRVRIDASIPLASGLGGEVSLAVAGLVGANNLLGRPLGRDMLIRIGAELTGRPENVSAAMLGGLSIAGMGGQEVMYRREAIAPLDVVVVLPELHLLTARLRGTLPDRVPLADAVFNIGRALLLARALRDGDFELLSRAVQDRLHQPYRKPFIPGYDHAARAAREAGAVGVVLCGAGPAMLAFARTDHHRVAEAMADAFGEVGTPARSWVLPVDRQGVVLTLVESA